jgi:hypothetical protein
VSEELRALAEKYREMIALRREAGVKDPVRLKRLAMRFPGSLRELDTRTMESLVQRLAELESGNAPSWASVQIRFHGWLRVALRMRAEGATDAWLAAYAPAEIGEPTRQELAARWNELLAPPGGRVSIAVRAALEVDDDLDVLLFGAQPR